MTIAQANKESPPNMTDMMKKMAGGTFVISGVLAFLGGLGYTGLYALAGYWHMGDRVIHGEILGLVMAAVGLLLVGLGRMCYSYWRKGMRVLLRMSIASYMVATVACSASWWREIQRWNTYEVVVAAVRNGALKPDKQGDILLPPSWAWATRNGHVYVMQEKGLTLLFPTTVDRFEIDWPDGTRPHWQIAGNVYSSEGLPKDHWFSFLDSKPDYDSVCVWDGKALRPHWYYAEPFYS